MPQMNKTKNNLMDIHSVASNRVAKVPSAGSYDAAEAGRQADSGLADTASVAAAAVPSEA